MKKITTSLALALIGVVAGAQSYYQDAANSEMLRHENYHGACRHEVILPQVNGYNVYTADLHTHTIFSDGQVHPAYRVREAWVDGIDIMAVTEHIEYRPHEALFVDQLKKYISPKYDKAVNNIHGGGEKLDENGIMVDLNYCIRMSQAEAANYGLLIIPGTEITRSGKYVGHFNGLFTTDNNTIYDPDPVQAVKNAKAQGALIMHNHPGWTRSDINFTDTEKVLYEAGLIDGVEVMNGTEFYPGVVDRICEYDQFIAANTDIHSTTAMDYTLNRNFRPMTLILAKEKTLESVREALEARRTLALGFNTVCGKEQLLKDFFAASMKVTVVRVTDRSIELAITNTSSIPYTITRPGHNQTKLDPFCTVRMGVSKDATSLKLTVLNMFCAKDRHPEVELTF